MKIKINETEYFINARNHKQIIKYADRICPMIHEEKPLKQTGVSNILLNLLLDEDENIRKAIADFVEVTTRNVSTSHLPIPTRESIEKTVSEMAAEDISEWRVFVYKTIYKRKEYGGQLIKLFSVLSDVSKENTANYKRVQQVLETAKRIDQQFK